MKIRVPNFKLRSSDCRNIKEQPLFDYRTSRGKGYFIGSPFPESLSTVEIVLLQSRQIIFSRRRTEFFNDSFSKDGIVGWVEQAEFVSGTDDCGGSPPACKDEACQRSSRSTFGQPEEQRSED